MTLLLDNIICDLLNPYKATVLDTAGIVQVQILISLELNLLKPIVKV